MMSSFGTMSSRVKLILQRAKEINSTHGENDCIENGLVINTEDLENQILVGSPANIVSPIVENFSDGFENGDAIAGTNNLAQLENVDFTNNMLETIQDSSCPVIDIDNCLNIKNTHFYEASTSKDHNDEIDGSYYENSDDSIKDRDYEVDECESSDESGESKQEEEGEADVGFESIIETGENVSEVLGNGKKRKQNKDKWKCTIRKQKRLAGEEYITKRKTLMGAKRMGSPCKVSCRYKCNTKISDVERQKIFDGFWSQSKNIDHKRQFVASSVRMIPIKRRRERSGERLQKRQFSHVYCFTIDNLHTEVCKKFFLSTLGISQTFVRTALTKKSQGGMVSQDQRGRKEPPNKISVEAKQSIRNHILKFPTIESHYSRERTSKKYLGNQLNISRMYDLYKQDCIEQNIPEDDIPKQWIYADIFKSEFNYSFKLPSNDTCDQCDLFLIQLKDSSTISERERVQKEYDGHLNEASSRYALKRIDKENAKSEKKTKVVMVDLEKCLPTPMLTNAQSFYSLKLWTFNYTIRDSSANQTTCCMWDESIAGRGGNEMASCLLKWVTTTLPSNVEHLIIWSDNCPSQNRNINSVLAYFTILRNVPTLKTISHKFLLRGHTHLEVDSDHSLIEREKKRMDQFQIMTPWDWQQLVRLASHKRPFNVISIETSDFKNFKSLIEGQNAPFISKKKTENGKNFKISEIVEIQVRNGEIGKLFYKTDFSTDYDIIDFSRVSRNAHFPDEIPLVLATSKPISSKKYKHLQNLLKWVPKIFHPFYTNLPQADTVDEDE